VSTWLIFFLLIELLDSSENKNPMLMNRVHGEKCDGIQLLRSQLAI